MTAQEIFDTVVTHLMTQRLQARNNSGKCFYRAPGGLKCAVGALITDDEYVPSMDYSDETSIGAIERAGLLPARLVPYTDLLQNLQRAHDNSAAEPEDVSDRWMLDFSACRHALSDIAVSHDLKFDAESFR